MFAADYSVRFRSWGEIGSTARPGAKRPDHGIGFAANFVQRRSSYWKGTSLCAYFLGFSKHWLVDNLSIPPPREMILRNLSPHINLHAG